VTVADAFRAHLSGADGDIDLARRVLRGVLRLALRELGEGDDSAAVAEASRCSATGAASAADAPTILEPRCDRLVDADGRCYDDDCPEHAGDGYDPIPAAAGAAPMPSVQPAEGMGKSGDTFALQVERREGSAAAPYSNRAPAAEGQKPALSRKRRLRIIDADGQEIG